MKRIWIFLILCLPLRAAVVTIEADDYTPGESMHEPFPNIILFSTGSTEIERGLLTLRENIVAVESSNPDKPLGYNVIGRSSSPSGYYNDYWYGSMSDNMYLFLEIYQGAKSITIHSAKKPGTMAKTIITKMFDANGVQVAYNFTTGSVLTVEKPDYVIRYAIYQPALVRSLDHIVIDYQPIPSFVEFVNSWLCECSVDNAWCEGSDINHDGIVNFKDYARLLRCEAP